MHSFHTFYTGRLTRPTRPTRRRAIITSPPSDLKQFLQVSLDSQRGGPYNKPADEETLTEHLTTEAGANTWVSPSHEDARREDNPRPTPTQGTLAADSYLTDLQGHSNHDTTQVDASVSRHLPTRALGARRVGVGWRAAESPQTNQGWFANPTRPQGSCGQKSAQTTDQGRSLRIAPAGSPRPRSCRHYPSTGNTHQDQAAQIRAHKPLRKTWGTFVRTLLILAIETYRNSFSVFVLSSCRFLPSCSVYAQEAIKRNGARRGLHLTVRRLLRCHPFSQGGLDPVGNRK